MKKNDLVQREIKKSNSVNALLESIVNKKEDLKEFGLEIKVFKNGKELKS